MRLLRHQIISKDFREGTALVLVLGVATILMVVGLSAVTAARVQLRGADGSNSAAAARCYAHSAIELGFIMIQMDADWRTNLGSGAWITDEPIGSGTLSLEVLIVDDDQDGDPTNDPAVLTGIGVDEQARHKTQVTVTPCKGGMVVSPGSWKQVVD